VQKKFYYRRENMKKKTKICGVCIALAAVLLISAALVTSCIEPVSPGGLTIKYGQVPNFTPPPVSERTIDLESPGAVDAVNAVDVEVVEEKGYLRLNVSAPDSGARTILPSGSPMSTIVQYMVITKRGSDAAESHPRVIPGDISDDITLTTGTYSVEVRGYATLNSDIVIVIGTASNVVISNTTPATPTIGLHEVYDNSEGGSGTFTWKFDLSTPAPGGATLNVTNWSGADTVPSTLKNVTLDIATDVSEVTGNGTLLSGYYYVDLTLTKTSCRTETYREIIHIANGLTSDWTKDDFYALSSNVYTVTYVEATGPTTSNNAVSGIAHGATLTKPANPTGYTSDIWYRTRTGTSPSYTYSNPWTFSTSGNKVIRSMSLYPDWQPAANGTLTITLGTFALDDGTNKTFTFAASGASVAGDVITYTQAAFEAAGPHEIIITLSGSPFTTAKLSIGATVLSDTAPDNNTPLTLTIDLDDDDVIALLGVGTSILTVEGRVSDTPYSALLYLKVE
jgi:hypothetical protein